MKNFKITLLVLTLIFLTNFFACKENSPKLVNSSPNYVENNSLHMSNPIKNSKSDNILKNYDTFISFKKTKRK